MTAPSDVLELRRPEGSPQPSCDVVICCYTEARWELLSAAVRSVEAQVADVHEVFLIVDHNEPMRERVAATWPQHTVMANTGGQGLSGGRNTGVRNSTADVVAFLDDDAVAMPEWLSNSLAWFTDPDVISVGARVEAEWEGRRPGWFPEEFDWVIGCSWIGHPTTASRIRNPIGAAMTFRRELFHRYGGFRGEFARQEGGVAGCDETELSLRVTSREPGSYVVLDPDALATQWVPADRQTLRYFTRRCFGEGIATEAVTHYAGMGSGTRTERNYVVNVLAGSIWRDVVGAVRHREPVRIARAAARVYGFAITAAGFARAKFKRAISSATIPVAPDVDAVVL